MVRKILESSGAAKPEGQALAIYRFVRDQLATEDLVGVSLREDSTLNGVLSKKSGDNAEKALVLQAMLKVAKIDSELVWAAARSEGLVDPKVPDPRWFDRVIVRALIDGQHRFLDPCSRALAFGRLDPEYEGTLGLVLTSKQPEFIELPVDPFEENLRHADLNLAIDDEGQVHGARSRSTRCH